MKIPRIVKAMEHLDAELISEASEEPRKKHAWKPIAAIAACLCLVIGAVQLFQQIGGSSGAGSQPRRDGDIHYMYYAGPVLPLTAQGATESLTVSRHVDYDFSVYLPVEENEKGQTRLAQSVVTDRYVLHNETQQDQTLTFYYPFVGNMREWEQYPVVTADGENVETVLRPGPYPPSIAEKMPPLDGYAGYASLLEDGSYLSSATDSFPTLDVPAVVYELHNYQYTENPDAISPTLLMEFTVDPEKTKVFSYGMNIGSWDEETGHCGRAVSGIKIVGNDHREPEPAYVILVGEDIADYTLQGYRDGGCDAGEELADLSCTVTRYETTLEQVIHPLMTHFLGTFLHQDQAMQPLDLYDGLTAELLCSRGSIMAFPTNQYDMGMLENIFSVVFTDTRVLYQSWELTIPAGEETEIQVVLRKDASRDYAGRYKERNGYDMATTLGSSLHFTQQSASVSHTEGIEIADQNFGFDLQKGITDVTLDLEIPHYWMEIRKISEKS